MKFNAFNNSSVVTQSWYVATRSSDLRAGQVKSYDLIGRRIAIYRDDRGVANALDARCPHLGADLGHGRVIGDALQCAFHGWRFGPWGECAANAALQARAYPVVERWGLIWLFNGPKALFDLPDAPPDLRVLRLPPQRIRCHPHLVIANGLDISHYESLHQMKFSTPPELARPDAHCLSLKLCGRPRKRWQQALTGTRRRELIARFTTIGGSLAWAVVEQPLRFEMLFSGRPARDGACETQTVLFARTRDIPRSLALMFVLLYDDHRILDDIKFQPNFTQADAPLKAFADMVNSLGVW